MKTASSPSPIVMPLLVTILATALIAGCAKQESSATSTPASSEATPAEGEATTESQAASTEETPATPEGETATPQQ